jgi:glycerol-3-phosphate acyltransferase PlsY
MIGAIILAVVLIVVIPVGLFLSGGIAIGVITSRLTGNAEDTHEGSELIDLNR